jgi:2-desacetyl-2-hydroxyethyl bacteriochlorophyllide A dehydrogenase
MRAIVIDGPRRAAMREAPAPEPGRGDVRVRIEGCGVCGSNLPLWQGQPWFTYPLAAGAPGHEGWGIVDAIGADVRTLALGERVALLSAHAYAEYDIAPAEAVVALPASFEGELAPVEAFACALNVVRRAALAPGSHVAVVGVGFLGALVVKLAARAGARVTAISRRAFALEIAASQGAHALVPLDEREHAIRDAHAAAGEDGYATVIEAAGTQAALDVASALVRTHGRLVVAGYHQDGARSVDMQSWNWRGLDVINAHERDPRTVLDGMRDAVALAAHKDWAPWELVTHAVPLRDAARALDWLAQRPPGFLKAVVVP